MDWDNREEMDKMVEELGEAASLCEDELGEYWECLCSLWPRILDGGTVGFQNAYETEIRGEHARLKKEFRIVEETYTKETKTRILLHESEWT